MSVFRLPKPIKRLHWKYRLLLWQIQRRFRDSVTLHTKQGIFQLPLDTSDAVSQHLYTRREFELELIESSLAVLRRAGKCPPRGQGTVLDIGANNGVISIGMLATGQLERAIAIEPDPRNFELLQRNVQANGLEQQFTCLNYAAADGESELAFELSEDNFGDHRVRQTSPTTGDHELFDESGRRVIQVPADTVDHLIAAVDREFTDKLALIWVDVQGYEGHVFRGARDLLRRDIPVMAEIWPYGLSRAGTPEEEFCEIVSGLWSTYWVEHRNRFTQHPIADFSAFLNSLGRGGKFKNVIFTK